ncbi:unnamed protein product, partial [Symbiodinium natans]
FRRGHEGHRGQGVAGGRAADAGHQLDHSSREAEPPAGTGTTCLRGLRLSGVRRCLGEGDGGGPGGTGQARCHRGGHPAALRPVPHAHASLC